MLLFLYLCVIFCWSIHYRPASSIAAAIAKQNHLASPLVSGPGLSPAQIELQYSEM